MIVIVRGVLANNVEARRMRKRRRGRLFQRNKETISVTFRNVRTNTDDTVADDIECVWHPNVAPIQYQDTVPILDADWRIVLDVPNSDINKTHTVNRSDDTEFEIVDVLLFGGAMHLLVKGTGVA